VLRIGEGLSTFELRVIAENGTVARPQLRHREGRGDPDIDSVEGDAITATQLRTMPTLIRCQ
jgi:hypothetical protein